MERNKKGQFVKGHIDFVSKKSRESQGKKISRIRKGMKFTEEHKENMSKVRKGKSTWSSTRKEEMNKKLKGRFTGKDSSQWQDGISKKPYGFDFTDSLKEVIRKRDGHICKKCNRAQEKELKEFGYKLPIHHIDYNKLNNNKTNLITLCKKCNSIVNKNRSDWTKFFQDKLYEKRN